jgi:hypothetical protein
MRQPTLPPRGSRKTPQGSPRAPEFRDSKFTIPNSRFQIRDSKIKEKMLQKKSLENQRIASPPAEY